MHRDVVQLCLAIVTVIVAIGGLVFGLHGQIRAGPPAGPRRRPGDAARGPDGGRWARTGSMTAGLPSPAVATDVASDKARELEDRYGTELRLRVRAGGGDGVSVVEASWMLHAGWSKPNRARVWDTPDASTWIWSDLHLGHERSIKPFPAAVRVGSRVRRRTVDGMERGGRRGRHDHLPGRRVRRRQGRRDASQGVGRGPGNQVLGSGEPRRVAHQRDLALRHPNDDYRRLRPRRPLRSCSRTCLCSGCRTEPLTCTGTCTTIRRRPTTSTST